MPIKGEVIICNSNGASLSNESIIPGINAINVITVAKSNKSITAKKAQNFPIEAFLTSKFSQNKFESTAFVNCCLVAPRTYLTFLYRAISNIHILPKNTNMNPVMKNFVIPLLYRKPENAGIATSPPTIPNNTQKNKSKHQRNNGPIGLPCAFCI